MCGIVGYIGAREAAPILFEGLSRLEYRGYDSAGLAVFDGSATHTLRSVGKLDNLRQRLAERPLKGHVGIGHTRWATHGRPSEVNAHPHAAGPITVVHNGIVENHLALRAGLEARGHVFKSETDTEIFSHLIREKASEGRALPEAVRVALNEVRGSYALLVFSADEPDLLVAAKNASPMVLGLGEGEMFLASDVPALIAQTREVLFLHEEELVVVRREGYTLMDFDGQPIQRASKRITWTPAQAEKGGYRHFMLKEIYEQPRAIADTLSGRVSLERGEVRLEDVHLSAAEAARINRVVMCACGTAWHAALVGRRLIEAATRIPVEVDVASELRYRDPIIDEGTLFIAVSQSGETADTLAALREARSRGARVLSVCNVIESSIARESHDVLYTHAGPEIGVASTKAFTTQLVALQLIALHLGRLRGALSDEAAGEILAELTHLPTLIEALLAVDEHVQGVARRAMHARDFLYLGRGPQFPIALEGALKLKEISYIHAEGYAAGEMKHGPIALIDEEMPVVVICLKDGQYDKTLSNLQEVRARDGRVIALATEGDTEIAALCDEVIYLPPVSETLAPCAAVIPLQLLAYHIADFKGTDVDQPRNLAKSVTVE
ncbi:glutamine--fructose-6-phosphate transaminase (isomerizing) [Myxococcota bacterium]|nr:glutamine--fructose-6-phosphate transaminase (isomerizing) [Myxococcota bacterium]